VRAQDDELPPRRQHAAPLGGGRLGAQAQEGQLHRLQDLPAHVETERLDHGRDELRHDVADEDQAVGAAEGPRGFHELAAADGEREACVNEEAH